MSSCKVRPTRYAHIEGHTDLCYSKDGKHIITCGSEGEVRIFAGIDDDDSRTVEASECAHAIAYKDGQILVGLETNIIQAFTFDDGSPDGHITRFTAPPTHIDVAHNGKVIAAASSDMTIKVHDVATVKDMTFKGHTAPVLSVTLDPKGEYLASSSCDGTVRVWNIELGMEVKCINILPKSNSFRLSTTLCRLAWSSSGDYLYVPVMKEVKVYDRSDWRERPAFTANCIKDTVSICASSPGNEMLAASCKNGVVIVWDIRTKQVVADVKHPKEKEICGLKWNPIDKSEIAFVDLDGQLGTIVDIGKEQESEETNDGEILSSTDVPVDNDDSNLDFPPPFVDDFANNDDNEDEFSIAKIKSDCGFADDEEGTFIGTQPGESIKSQVKEEEEANKINVPPAPVFKMPEIQAPFQPGMSPEHVEPRYMVWNSVGMVRQYSSDNTIDVEFHDTSVHHSMSQVNSHNFTMAALNHQVLALACEAQEDQPSKLQVYNLASWDGNKEWFVDMPEDEEILAVCTGRNWVAVATDRRNLRVFSSTGIQRDLLSISGPIVCLSGHEDSIFIVYHSGMGVAGDQKMSGKVFNLSGSRHQMPIGTEVDLSPKSFLSWAGFSDEGTPAIMDSAGIVKMINPKYGYNWAAVLNTRAHTKGKSDHYFMLGISEKQCNVRCIMCRGSRFPPVSPRPHVSILDIKIPLCELDTDKTEFEEKIISRTLLNGTFTRLLDDGFQVEDAQKENQKLLNEKIIRLFALCCQTDKDMRGYELAQLMTTQYQVKLALRYAGSQKKVQLTEKLGELATTKAEEEQENMHKQQQKHYHYNEEIGYLGNTSKPQKSMDVESEEDEYEEECDVTQQRRDEDSSQLKPSRNPLLEARRRKNGTTKPPSHLMSQSNRNPFKKGGNNGSNSNMRGIDLIDNNYKLKTKVNEETTQVLKPFTKKTSIQPNIKSKLSQQVNGKENKTSNDNKPTVAKKAAFQLWFEDNVEFVKSKFPETPDNVLVSRAAILFKDLDDDTKQRYKCLASSQSDKTISIPEDDSIKKRKLEDNNIDNSIEDKQVEKKAKGSGISKLSAFAFNKDD